MPIFRLFGKMPRHSPQRRLARRTAVWVSTTELCRAGFLSVAFAAERRLVLTLDELWATGILNPTMRSLCKSMPVVDLRSATESLWFNLDQCMPFSSSCTVTSMARKTALLPAIAARFPAANIDGGAVATVDTATGACCSSPLPPVTSVFSSQAVAPPSVTTLGVCKKDVNNGGDRGGDHLILADAVAGTNLFAPRRRFDMRFTLNGARVVDRRLHTLLHAETAIRGLRTTSWVTLDKLHGLKFNRRRPAFKPLHLEDCLLYLAIPFARLTPVEQQAIAAASAHSAVAPLLTSPTNGGTGGAKQVFRLLSLADLPLTEIDGAEVVSAANNDVSRDASSGIGVSMLQGLKLRQVRLAADETRGWWSASRRAKHAVFPDGTVFVAVDALVAFQRRLGPGAVCTPIPDGSFSRRPVGCWRASLPTEAASAGWHVMRTWRSLRLCRQRRSRGPAPQKKSQESRRRRSLSVRAVPTDALHAPWIYHRDAKFVCW